MNISDIDWEDLHERTQGYRVEDPTGKRLANIVTRMGTSVMDSLKAHGGDVVTEIQEQMKKAGIPLRYRPYVFFALMESEGFWPTLTQNRKESLKMSLRIMQAAGVTPIYSRGLQVPDFEEAEAVMDQVILEVANWADKSFRNVVWKDIGQKLKAFIPETQKLLGVSTSDATTKLVLKLREVTRNNPSRIGDPSQLLDLVLDWVHWL